MALAITKAGMVASVGKSAGAVCAALRADLSHPNEIEYFTVLDEKENLDVPIVGHPVHALTEGFVATGRYLRLAEATISDLCAAYDPVPQRYWERTRLAVVMPRLDEDRFEAAQDGGAAELADMFVDQFLSVTELPIAQGVVFPFGSSGLARALATADQAIGSGSAERFLIVALDSLLDVLTLEWLHQSNRLKSRANPVGTCPGEAGAAIVVESVAAARRGPTLGIIERAAFDQEPNHFFSGNPNSGEGLARAVRAAAGDQTPIDGDLFLDLNGEEWRALEWGSAVPRLRGVLGDSMRVVLPASAVGDVGAALGLVSLIGATHAFAKDYAAGSRSMIVSSSEYGDVGAVLVRKGD